MSKIEWTDITWNPSTGCSKVSPGCKNCYAERISNRLRKMGVSKYSKGFKVVVHYDTLRDPYTWKKSRRVFVNSMSDLFHEDIPTDFIQKVFRVMNNNPQHIFQVLTKRPERIRYYNVKWTQNIWLGTSIENERYLKRIKPLKDSSAFIKFLSLEPLLGPLDRIQLEGIHWVIVGGESGPGARPMQKIWVKTIQKKCEKENIPFFFKQWGGTNKAKTGRLLDSKEYNAFPERTVELKLF